MTAAGIDVGSMFQDYLPVELPFVKTHNLTTVTASSCTGWNHGINILPVEICQPVNLHGEQSNSQSKPMDTFPCNLLTVRIIRMRNLRKADVLSQSDCYVTLWLPTATCEKQRTKTINNCKDPVWNESFYYRIQKQVKNILELNVYDEDVVTPDDHLFTVRFDIARLPDDRSVVMTFKSDPKEQEELDVEFLVEPAQGPPETIITNGVLVNVWARETRGSLLQMDIVIPNTHKQCREVSRLEAEVDLSKPHKSKRDLSLTVKGSCEGSHCFKLGSDAIIMPPCPTTFHFVKYNEPSLDVKLPKRKPRFNPCTCSYKTKPGVPTVMLNSLPKGEKVPIVEEKKYNLHVTVNDCHCSCPGDLDVRLGYDLCPQEQDFLCKRKRHVAQALKQVLHLNYDLKDHEVPVVAVMTTGGGTRSFTTTFGSLRGLQKLNLLDCITYISGLSGTCWSMAHLYRDAHWSHGNLDELIREAKKQVTKSKLGIFTIDRVKYYHQQLNQRKREGYKTTFIDLWGLMIEYLLNEGKDNHKLSEQREALTEGQNPLPIYVAINIKKNYSTQDFKEWVEFTPYEVGFLKYGTFVGAENFGSEFFMGRMIKKLPETRISFLHGMWSSIFSVNLLYLLNQVNNSEEFWHRWTRDKIIDLEEDPSLPTRPYELRTHMYVPAGNLSSAFRGVLTDRLSVAQYNNFLKGLQLHNNYLENEQFQRWKATVLDHCPNQLTEHEDHVGFVDAGFFINTSCPPLLRRERKVDIILHLSYSGGSQTMPLEEASKFYSEQGIPFPNVVLTEEDKKRPKECYYFNQTGATECPDVLFFPLVNDTFQHYRTPGEKRNEDEMDAGKVDVSSISSPYGTHLLTYSDDDFDKLLNLSEYNIMNNQHMILQALNAAVAQKRQSYYSN